MVVTCLAGCETVDPGDNFVPPDLMLDEDFFFCRIQPEVITRNTCASGMASEAGTCHSSRSALRLSAAAESDPPPNCQDGVVSGPVPPSYMNNLDAVRFTVQSDPQSSPFYRRPVGIDAHPRKIFDEGSPEAQLIVTWINGGAM